MSHYKLTYFNGRGRAELSRLIFVVAGVQYEDVRFEKDEWPAIKPTTPFGQVPVLEVDGVKLAQSYSIARLLARRFNLAGKTDLDQARADMIVDCLHDILVASYGVIVEVDEVRKAELKKKFVEEQLPAFLNSMEKLLVENKGGDGYFVGDDLTWADLDLLVVASILASHGYSDEFEKRKKLHALQKRVESLPKIAEWLAKRPKTEF